MSFNLEEFIKYVKGLMHQKDSPYMRVEVDIEKTAERAEQHPLYTAGFLAADRIPTYPYPGFDPIILDQDLLPIEVENAEDIVPKQSSLPKKFNEKPTPHTRVILEHNADQIALAILENELPNEQFSPNLKTAAERLYGNLSTVTVLMPEWSKARRGTTTLVQDVGWLDRVGSGWTRYALCRWFLFFSNIHEGVGEKPEYQQLYRGLGLHKKTTWIKYVSLMNTWEITFPKRKI